MKSDHFGVYGSIVPELYKPPRNESVIVWTEVLRYFLFLVTLYVISWHIGPRYIERLIYIVFHAYEPRQNTFINHEYFANHQFIFGCQL